MDRRTALTAVLRQPGRHARQLRRLQHRQPRFQICRCALAPLRRHAEQIRCQLRRQGQMVRSRQIQTAQSVADLLRRTGPAVSRDPAPLLQQAPQDLLPLRQGMRRAKCALIRQLGTVLGLHQRISCQMLPQDCLEFLIHTRSPSDPGSCRQISADLRPEPPQPFPFGRAGVPGRSGAGRLLLNAAGRRRMLFASTR